MDKTEKTILKVLKFIFKIERTIYCRSNCRIELPLHKAYYARGKEKYEEYLSTKNSSN